MADAREVDRPERGSYLEGARASAPFTVTILILGVSFGVLAAAEGMSAVPAVAMSALVFGASAQFGAVSVLGAGGGAVAAIVAGLLLNARFGPMGVAVAPYLHGGPAQRFLESLAIVDTSWALANRGGGRFDREFLIGCTIPQYPAWVLGTAVGVIGGSAIGDLEALGLDAVFATFFLYLLVGELRDPGGRVVAALAAGVALALLPFTPPGVPIVAGCLAALLGLRGR